MQTSPNRRQPAVTMHHLPMEMLEEIVKVLDQACSTTREQKDAFYALKNSSSLFSRLSIVNRVLFREIHVFYTSASNGRLKGISSDPTISQVVKKVTFHRPALASAIEFWEDLSKEDRADCAIGSLRRRWNNNSEDLLRRDWVKKYDELKRDLKNNPFAAVYKHALSNLHKVRSLGVSANNDSNQFMTAQDSTDSTRTSALRTRTHWSHRSRKSRYPIPCDHLDSFHDWLVGCESLTDWNSVLASLMNSQHIMLVETLNMDGLTSDLLKFSWSRTQKLPSQLRRLELERLEMPWPEKMMKCLGSAKNLTELRMVGLMGDGRKAPYLERCIIERMDCPSLRVLEIGAFVIFAKTVQEILLRHPGLRHLHLTGVLRSMELSKFDEVSSSIRNHPGLSDPLSIVTRSFVELSTLPEVGGKQYWEWQCTCNLEACEACNDRNTLRSYFGREGPGYPSIYTLGRRLYQLRYTDYVHPAFALLLC